MPTAVPTLPRLPVRAAPATITAPRGEYPGPPYPPPVSVPISFVQVQDGGPEYHVYGEYIPDFHTECNINEESIEVTSILNEPECGLITIRQQVQLDSIIDDHASRVDINGGIVKGILHKRDPPEGL